MAKLKVTIVADWNKNLGKFKEQILHKIRQNLKEKGLSWREMTDEELWDLAGKYSMREDWVSVGNIAFMLWENQQEREG